MLSPRFAPIHRRLMSSPARVDVPTLTEVYGWIQAWEEHPYRDKSPCREQARTAKIPTWSRYGLESEDAPPTVYREKDFPPTGGEALLMQRGVIFLENLFEALVPAATLPGRTALLSNYPNPFNPETWIPYQLAHPAEVTLIIYDTQGAPVRQFELGHQPASAYTDKTKAVYWDGTNESGEPVSSGVYFYQLRVRGIPGGRGFLAPIRPMVIRK